MEQQMDCIQNLGWVFEVLIKNMMQDQNSSCIVLLHWCDLPLS